MPLFKWCGDAVAENDKGLENLYSRVGKLEQVSASNETRVQRIEKELYNGGKDGFIRMMTDFVTMYNTKQAEREIEDRRREMEARATDRKWNLRILALGTIFAFFEMLHGCDGKKIAFINSAQVTQQDAGAHYTPRSNNP